MYEYKVLSQKDIYFSGKFNPYLLEKAINEYAQLGWRVKAITTANINGVNRDELLVVFERKIDSDPIEYDLNDPDSIVLPKI